MPDTLGPGPGYARAPNHKVELKRDTARVRVIFAGETIADSADVITVHEGSYPPVHYLTRADVREEVLTRTDHSTHCPFKGDASYWSVTAGGKTAENAVWSYEAVFDEVPELAGRVAFYADKMDEIIADPA